MSLLGLWCLNKNYFNQNNLSIYQKELEKLDFSVRTHNVFKSNNIIKVQDLLEYKEEDFLKFQNSGKKTQKEVQEFLINNDLKFGQRPPKQKEIKTRITQLDLSNFIIHKLEDNGVHYLEDLVKLKKEELLNIFVMEKYFFEIEKAISQYEEPSITQDNNIPEFIRLDKEIELFLIKKIEEINFSNRVINQTKINGIVRMGDLLPYKDNELLSLPNFGVRSLIELKDYFKKNNIDFNLEIIGWDKDNIERLEKEYDEVLSNNIDDQYFPTIEEEINFKLSHLDNSRNVEIYKNYYGLDNSPQKTLEIVGIKNGLTRERVRQILAKINRKIVKQKIKFNKFDALNEEINSHAPISIKSLYENINKSKLSFYNWDPNSIYNFLKTITSNINWRIYSINNYDYFIPSDHNFPNLKEILSKIRRNISSSGCYSINLLYENDLRNLNLNKEFLIQIIETEKNFKWLDNEKNWFSFYSSRSRLINTIIKLITIKNNISIDELSKSISKNYRIPTKNLPIKVLENFCLHYFDCQVNEEIVTFNSNAPKFHKQHSNVGLSSIEKTFINIFTDYGPILNYEDIIEFGKINYVKDASISAFLQWSPVVKRIDIGFYILQSAKIKDMEKEEKIYSQIEISDHNYYDKEECPAIPNKITYIEVLNKGNLIKSLPYTRPVRTMPDGTTLGAVYKKKVYPIIRQYRETSNGEREEI